MPIMMNHYKILQRLAQGQEPRKKPILILL